MPIAFLSCFAVVRWFVGNHSFPTYQDNGGWQNGRQESTRKQNHCGELRREEERQMGKAMITQHSTV